MNQGYFYSVLLYCVKHFNGERTLSAIYHLLNGKKTSQTIQDGKLFNLSHLFSLFSGMPRSQVMEAFENCIQKGWCLQIHDNHFILTEKGESFLNLQLRTKPLPPSINGWEFGDIGRVFWGRISLLVQVLSNNLYGISHYIPVTKNQDVLLWAKKFLQQVNYSKSELIEGLYKELNDCLILQKNDEATIFVQRLTSSQKIGKTFEQIALVSKEDPVYIFLQFWNVIHSILNTIQLEEIRFPILNELLKDKQTKHILTASTSKTRNYLQQGLTINEIAVIRQLKESTIEDHIVEITLHDPTYYPESFLGKHDLSVIKGAITFLQTHQLKKVKEYLEHKYSYFQIRLAFALYGRNE